jgi:hypothetical protein
LSVVALLMTISLVSAVSFLAAALAYLTLIVGLEH